jgi:glycosyltransferase involved in cell wall biosynthesis
VCYLAGGRPVITQDTGIRNIIPTGEGLFVFATEEEAIVAIEAIAGNYEKHSAAANAVAREYFDAERVLGDVLRVAGLL